MRGNEVLLMNSGYEPRKPDRRFLKFTGRFGAALVAVLWFVRAKIGIDTSSMCILTGIAIFNLVMQSIDRKAVEENYRQARAIRENRDTIDSNDIGGDE